MKIKPQILQQAKYPFHFLIFILLSSPLGVALAIILTTCSDPGFSDNKVTFSGTVTLEDEEDYSGVT